MQQHEKRSAERRSLRVPLLCWDVEGGEATGDGAQYVTTDLSAGGLSFETDRIRPIDSLLHGEIHLPGGRTPTSVKMTVARIESVLGGSSYLVGTRYVDPSPEDRERISGCLDHLDLYRILQVAIEQGASDIHLTLGRPPVARVDGQLRSLELTAVEEGQVRAMLYPLLTGGQIESLERDRELDFAFSPDVRSRFRVNLHYQRGFLEATLRSVPTQTRSFDELGLPVPQLGKFCRARSGLVLIAGTTGAGKTTTMASMVDHINRSLERVVIAIEDPIEFTHTSDRSIVKQRELGSDTRSYASALRRALRQDPDVIVVGELTDSDCVQAALRAAETGHLVITTVHAPDSGQAVERIVNLFPPEHGAHVCQQISSCLVGILYQTLLPGCDGGRVLGTELLIANHAVRNMIRDARFNQILNCVQTGRDIGMYTMQASLENLHRSGKIDAGLLARYGKRGGP